MTWGIRGCPAPPFPRPGQAWLGFCGDWTRAAPGCRRPLQGAPAASVLLSWGQQAPVSGSGARGLGLLNIKPVPAGLSGPHTPAGHLGSRALPAPGAEDPECTSEEQGPEVQRWLQALVSRGLHCQPPSPGRCGYCCGGRWKSPHSSLRV